MRSPWLNRGLNLLIVIGVVLVIGIETYTYWFHQLRPWQPASAMARIGFYYSFFTVLSNIMLALGCLILVIRPNCTQFIFNIIRLSGLVGVLITLIVYNLLLRGIHHPPTRLLQFTNESLHLIIPLVALFTWLVYGPFGRITIKVIMSAFLLLLGYGVYVFVRGYYTGQYAYPFINVSRVGYEHAFFAAGAVAILYFLLVLLLMCIEWLRLKIGPCK